jgi:hypothetical protein
MEPEPRLDLEESIVRWRSSLDGGALDADTLAELEAHLRDSIADATSRGASLHEAFSDATRRLGHGGFLSSEFSKLTSHTSTMNLRSILTTPRARYIGRLVLIAIAIVLPLRAFAIAPYRVVNDSVAPKVPAKSHVMVWRIAPQFVAGDIAVYHNGDHDWIGRVKAVAPESLTISRTSEPDIEVPRKSVVGRVVLATR